MAMDDAAGTLSLSGPAKLVESARQAAAAVVRAHAHTEEVLPLTPVELQLVKMILERSLASKPAQPPSTTANGTSNGGAKPPPPPRPTFFDGIVPQFRERADGGMGADLALRGTADPVATSKQGLEAVLAEATAAAVRLPTCAAAIDKLTRERAAGRVDAPVREPSEAPTGRPPRRHRRRPRGERADAAEAVAAMQLILEAELDVDEHTRYVNDRLIPIIIGRGGSNIKKLQADTGATVDLDRAGGRVSVRGRKAQVAAAVGMLDELCAGNGERELRVNSRQIPQLIGRGGSNIRQLQADSGATIDVRKEDSLVRVRGAPAAVEDAVRRIHELLAESAPPPPQKTSARAATAAGPPPGLAPPPGLPSSKQGAEEATREDACGHAASSTRTTRTMGRGPGRVEQQRSLERAHGVQREAQARQIDESTLRAH
eukprot:CAMPEP_0115860504 /NCGR_PEP_ID=MMETSP0287-20121206/17163_1 /TAXON_ID=412157 /ORGANISM="Chrysochromulina rotalis, Strain UIO044" /LENGTH=429 /DNA_ID=CAMNT_0003314833 /DNA_START=31 /DNA_END=1321 /DNA_ORIENTATION=+